MSVITRLNIGGPTMHMLLLAREMAALEYRTVLVAGSCEPEDGDMSYLLRAADSVRWVPELSRSVRPIARDHKPYVLAALQCVFDGGGQQRDVLNRH